MPTAIPSVSDSLTPSQLVPAVTELIKMRQPAMVWGAPGIGKSDIYRQIADSLGMVFHSEYASTLSDVDTRGIPARDGDRTIWLTPDFMPRPGCPPTLLVFDDFTRANMSTQNALFPLILEGRIGTSYVLPDNCVVCGAANRETDGGGVNRISQALANRFVHLDLTHSVDDWSDWANGAGIAPVVQAFIRFRPALLHAYDAKAHAWPSPRTWEFVSRIVKRNLNAVTQHALVRGAVGNAAVEFATYERMFNAMQGQSVAAIIADPDGAPVPNDIISQYAVASALAHNATPVTFGPIMRFLKRMRREFAAFAIRDAVKRTPALESTREFANWTIATHNANA